MESNADGLCAVRVPPDASILPIVATSGKGGAFPGIELAKRYLQTTAQDIDSL